jgi:DNA-binding transcriptional MerR regulator
MMKEKEKLLRIGDVAELIEVPVHTLRYWERMFKEDLSPYRSSGGQRIYSEGDVIKIREVKKLLKEEGYSIHGVRRILKNDTRNKELFVPSSKREPDWSAIALDVTRLIRERFYER